MMKYVCPACKETLETEDDETATNFNFRILIHQNEHIMHSVFLTANNTRTGYDRGDFSTK